MTTDDGTAGRERFAVLPEPVRPETWVETVDAATHPVVPEEDERARLLRTAGGGVA
jgi:hypothetical protein